MIGETSTKTNEQAESQTGNLHSVATMNPLEYPELGSIAGPMDEQAEFERAYCLMLASLRALDALNLDVPAAHLSQAIAAMERCDAAASCDLAALREQASQARSALH